MLAIVMIVAFLVIGLICAPQLKKLFIKKKDEVKQVIKDKYKQEKADKEVTSVSNGKDIFQKEHEKLMEMVEKAKPKSAKKKVRKKLEEINLNNYEQQEISSITDPSEMTGVINALITQVEDEFNVTIVLDKEHNFASMEDSYDQARCIDNQGYEDKIQNGVIYLVKKLKGDYVTIDSEVGGEITLLKSRVELI